MHCYFKGSKNLYYFFIIRLFLCFVFPFTYCKKLCLKSQQGSALKWHLITTRGETQWLQKDFWSYSSQWGETPRALTCGNTFPDQFRVSFKSKLFLLSNPNERLEYSKFILEIMITTEDCTYVLWLRSQLVRAGFPSQIFQSLN